jgi:aconitate hydratase
MANFGILPLEFINSDDYGKIEQGDIDSLKNLRSDVENRNPIKIEVSKDSGKKFELETTHSLSDRQINILLKGGIINEFKEKLSP